MNNVTLTLPLLCCLFQVKVEKEIVKDVEEVEEEIVEVEKEIVFDVKKIFKR